MGQDEKVAGLSSHYGAVRVVLWRVLVANIAITIIKIGLGLVTGALAVVADGFHSLVDSSSNLIGLAAIRLAGQPADSDHPYGHRRYETIGALAIGGLLLAAAWEILQGIIQRIFSGTVPEITPLTFVLVVLTLPVNIIIVVLETRAGHRLNSQILLADATHTRTDLFVTCSVIASLGATWLGLPWLDLVVAAGVGVLIVRAAFGILQDASRWLTDTIAVEPERVDRIARSVPGVIYVHAIRSRGTPDAIFVDLHVKVHSGMSTVQAHAIATAVEDRLKAEIENLVEALVHIEPARELPPNHWERIAYDLRQIADGMGLGLHDLHVRENQYGGYAIELHLEMPRDITLKQAHDLAEEFEGRVQKVSSKPHTIITHLEPLNEHVVKTAAPKDLERKAAIQEVLVEFVGEDKLLEVQFYRVWDHINLAARIGMAGELPLAEVHANAENIERELLTRFPDLERVTVHMEPLEQRAVGHGSDEPVGGVRT